MVAIYACSAFICSQPSYSAPNLSHIMTFFSPMLTSSLVTAIAAAPAPLTTILISDSLRPVRRQALIIAAAQQIAVPCWSSWNTGMSQRSFSLRSISKQRGAAMSSRLMPPKEPEISATVLTNSSTSLVLTQSGNASTPPNSLNSAHLPSITGIPASGPISPRPSTAEPSVITATRL